MKNVVKVLADNVKHEDSKNCTHNRSEFVTDNFFDAGFDHFLGQTDWQAGL